MKSRGTLLSVLLVLVLAIGCNGKNHSTEQTDTPKTVSTGPLRILVIDDEPLGEAIQRQWQARSENIVELRNVKTDELDLTSGKLSADAVIYPAGLLGDLVQHDLISSVPEHVLSHPGLDRHDILPWDRGPNVSWGNTVYAFSFGSPQLVLMYRRDLFEQLGISPPRFWNDYQEVAERLGDREVLGDSAPPEDQPWSGTTEPLAGGWAGQLLLARAAAYARRRSRFSTLFNYQTMQPLIDREPFVKALDELVAAAKSAPRDAAEQSPHDAQQAILAGRCAMALCWPARRIDSPEPTKLDQPVEIGIAPLPGATLAFSFSENRWEPKNDNEDQHVPLLGVAGRIGSVVKSSRRSRSATNMLVTLTGKDVSGQVATRSQYTSVFRASQLARVTQWVDAAIDRQAAQEYANVVEQAQQHSLWLFSVRIPGREQYLAALDDAVHQALNGTTSLQALRSAASRWDQINRSRGLQSQRNAYSKSLGLEP